MLRTDDESSYKANNPLNINHFAGYQSAKYLMISPKLYKVKWEITDYCYTVICKAGNKVYN